MSDDEPIDIGFDVVELERFAANMRDVADALAGIAGPEHERVKSLVRAAEVLDELAVEVEP